jgi:hypothetical protein
LEEYVFKRAFYVTTLFVALTALPLVAQRAPSAVRGRVNPVLQRCGTGVNIVFTNLTGPNHHKYNPTTGYFVDGSNFFNQVLGHGFTPTSTVTFSDVIIPMGVYTDGGGQNNAGTINVYLESDAGGVPGGIIEGPLTRCQGISNFNDGYGGNFVEFDCVTCTTSLKAGTMYWIVAQQSNPNVQLTWDEVRGITDASSPFVFNQTGNPTGDWIPVGSGYPRGAYTVDSF